MKERSPANNMHQAAPATSTHRGGVHASLWNSCVSFAVSVVCYS
jgi:hypothetical protein